MTFLLYFHIALSAIGAIVCFLLQGQLPAISFLAGAGTILLNFLALVGSWPFILAKKLVALSIGVIVFKFAILGWIIYEVATGTYILKGWFSLGLVTVVPSAVAASFKFARDNP